MDIKTHVYLRDVDPDKAHDSLSKIYRAVEPNTRVLDVGVGSGGLGKRLSEQKNCHVDGITYNEEELVVATPGYAKLYLLDLEQDPTTPDIASSTYDWIVFADVLEHLRNASSVLRNVQRLLKPDGKIIISVPHAAHSAVVLNLLDNRLDRTGDGLLDSTHVHLLDRRGLQHMVTEAGLEAVAHDDVHKSTADSEFRGEQWRHLPQAVLQYVQQRVDADVYQFVWTLRVAESTTPAKALAQARTPLHLRTATYTIKLYWSDDHAFDEKHSVVAFAANTTECVHTDFTPNWVTAPQKVRLNIADQLGIAELVAFELYTRESVSAGMRTPVWRWSPDPSSCESAGLQWLGIQGPHGGVLVEVLHEDAHIVVSMPGQNALAGPIARVCWQAVAPNPLVRASVLSNRVEFRALEGQIEQTQQNLRADLAHNLARIDESNAHRLDKLASLQHSAQDAQQQTSAALLAMVHSHRDQSTQDAQRLIQLLLDQRTERQHIDTHQQTLASERHAALLETIDSGRAQFSALQLQLDQALTLAQALGNRADSISAALAQSQQRLAALEQSRSWKLTAPLRQFNGWISRLLGRI